MGESLQATIFDAAYEVIQTTVIKAVATKALSLLGAGIPEMYNVALTFYQNAKQVIQKSYIPRMSLSHFQ
jgi:hypothetical protein